MDITGNIALDDALDVCLSVSTTETRLMCYDINYPLPKPQLGVIDSTMEMQAFKFSFVREHITSYIGQKRNTAIEIQVKSRHTVKRRCYD